MPGVYILSDRFPAMISPIRFPATGNWLGPGCWAGRPGFRNDAAAWTFKVTYIGVASVVVSVESKKLLKMSARKSNVIVGLHV